MRVKRVIKRDVNNCWECPYKSEIHSDDAFTDSWTHHYCREDFNLRVDDEGIPDNCPVKRKADK